ncbi:MAG: SRPBCC family protein [Chloroflexi bacterium]|nr:MAG: SRPBCC family protein [Chloroflexota bacterium]
MDNRITKSIIIKADAEQAYQIWENFENFPMFMKNVKSVSTTSPTGHLSHWVITGPMGKDVEWTAEMTTREEGRRIGWNTKDREGDVTTSGQVTFTQLGHGDTEVTVTMNYDPSQAGFIGEKVAQIFTNPEKMVEEDLSNFKNYVEGRHDRTM